MTKKKKVLMNIKELRVPNITGVTYMSGRRRIWLNTLKMKQKIDYTTESPGNSTSNFQNA